MSLHYRYPGLVDEKERRKRQQLFNTINEQSNIEQVLEAVRQNELPQFLHQNDISFEELDHFDRQKIVTEWSERDYKFRVLSALETMKEDIDRLKTDYRLVNVRRGRTHGNYFAVGTTLITIDLVDTENSRGLPSGFRLDLPRKPLPKLTLINYGAGDLYFSTNEDANSRKATTVVKAPAANTNPIPWVIDFHEPVLERINLLGSVALNVNLIAEI